MKKRTIRVIIHTLPWAMIAIFIAVITAIELGRKATEQDESIGELTDRCDSLEMELLQMKNENMMLAVHPEFFYTDHKKSKEYGL